MWCDLGWVQAPRTSPPMYVVRCLSPVPWGGYGGSVGGVLWCEVREPWEGTRVVARPCTNYFILILLCGFRWELGWRGWWRATPFLIFFLLYKTKCAFLEIRF